MRGRDVVLGAVSLIASRDAAPVAQFSQIEGYKSLSLTRALDVVKCQLALA